MLKLENFNDAYDNFRASRHIIEKREIIRGVGRIKAFFDHCAVFPSPDVFELSQRMLHAAKILQDLEVLTGIDSKN